jgi:hypothetical protein
VSSKKKSIVWDYFTHLPSSSINKENKASCNLCNSDIGTADYCTTLLLRNLKIQHDINPKADKRGSPADSETENSTKKSKTVLDFVQRQSLEDIV